MNKIFSLACNWDTELIEGVKGQPISSMYAKLRQDIFGGGRVPYNIKDISFEELKNYINKMHNAGIKLIYLLNNTCNSNNEYTSKFKINLLNYVKKLKRMDVDYFCVANPYIAQVLKKNFSDIKLDVSTLAFVRTPKQAKFWESIGADQICLAQSVNKDFNLIKAIRRSVTVPLKILVNDPCIIDCPMATVHSNYRSHSVIGGIRIEDYCNLSCKKSFFEDPAEILKSSVIRPEDLEEYEKLGINYFKIVDRLMDTSWLLKVFKAYNNRKYRGNLLDLLPFYEKIKKAINQEGNDFELFIDNSKLNNFLDHIKENNCQINCGESCIYCSYLSKGITKTKNIHKAIQYYDSKLKKLI
ncbi:hypothetical protein GF327_00390 [Candidatus Woesearchaeota archaeon]|nr:hypothetical protein [Candidatus Woesearchaeota archaeon]